MVGLAHICTNGLQEECNWQSAMMKLLIMGGSEKGTGSEKRAVANESVMDSCGVGIGYRE